MIKEPTTAAIRSRRSFMATGGVMLSAVSVALLGGRDALAARTVRAARDVGNPADDVAILNVALALEHEGIAAYQLGAESGLLQQPQLNVAVQFQSQHKSHRDTLEAAIQKLGGSPVAARPMAEYKRMPKLNIGGIKSATDILRLAQRLELGAANAYLGVIPAFESHALAKVAGRLAVDETMHYTVLTQALGDALPNAALTYGA